VPELLEKYNVSQQQFQGALILDTIMNYDPTDNSQTIPGGFGFKFVRQLFVQNYIIITFL
jgi:hypothetical protein